MTEAEKMPFVRFIRTNRFLRAYRKLDERDREQVKKALAQFVTDRAHPGLRVKRIRGAHKIWEMRAGRDIRVTFQYEEDDDGTRGVVLGNVGHHDPTLSNP
jgi:mRNA-degrading endonuclease RelE of RelBE toxin-antitoxin system